MQRVPLAGEGIASLLTELKCLQCRALLLEGLYSVRALNIFNCESI